MTDDELRRAFRDRFGIEPRVSSAPGRVNLIGEHTDYNDGFVLPMAIERTTRIAFAPIPGADRIIVSGAFPDDERRIPPGAREPQGQWIDYVEGVLRMLEAGSIAVGGAALWIESDVPVGAGLSSSAALEVATAGALLELAGRRMAPQDVALLCQRAENEFVGTRCGIMDQFIACLAQPGCALQIDCRSRAVEQVAVPADLEVLVLNSGVRHALADGEYNRRRAECERVVDALGRQDAGIRSLRDADLEGLEAIRGDVDETSLRRARHVLTENARVHDLVSALGRGDAAGIARAMAASHESLRADFEVSCAELDRLVDLAAGEPGVVGARMTGGGFGGCTVNLVEAGRGGLIHERISADHERETGRPVEGWVTGAAGAAHVA